MDRKLQKFVAWAVVDVAIVPVDVVVVAVVVSVVTIGIAPFVDAVGIVTVGVITVFVVAVVVVVVGSIVSVGVVKVVKVAADPDVFWLPVVLTPGKSIAAEPLKLTPPIFLAVVSVAAEPVVF